MNRRGLIILFSVIIAILVIVLIWGIAGNRNGIHSTAGLQGLERIAEFETDSSGITGLQLNFNSAHVVIQPADDSRISLVQDGFGGLPDYEQMRCGVRGSLVVASVPSPVASGCQGTVMSQSVVTVSIPADMHLEVNAGTLSGDIELRGLQLGNCSLDTLSGRITAENIQAQQVSLDTASGDIGLRGLRAGDCSINTLSGMITAGEIDAQQVSLGTSSGDIRATDLSCQDVEADSLSGTVYLEAQTEGEVSVDTASGNAEFLGAAQKVDMESASGSITAEVTHAVEISTESMSGDTRISCPGTALLRSIHAEAASGSVSIRLPEDTALNIDYDSGSGQLRTEHAGGLILGDGRGIEVRVSTGSGDFYLETL